MFGAGHDIYIASGGSSSSSYLGNTYNPPKGHSLGSEFAYTFLAGTHVFKPDEVEVFYETV